MACGYVPGADEDDVSRFHGDVLVLTDAVEQVRASRLPAVEVLPAQVRGTSSSTPRVATVEECSIPFRAAPAGDLGGRVAVVHRAVPRKMCASESHCDPLPSGE